MEAIGQASVLPLPQINEDMVEVIQPVSCTEGDLACESAHEGTHAALVIRGVGLSASTTSGAAEAPHCAEGSGRRAAVQTTPTSSLLCASCHTFCLT